MTRNGANGSLAEPATRDKGKRLLLPVILCAAGLGTMIGGTVVNTGMAVMRCYDRPPTGACGGRLSLVLFCLPLLGPPVITTAGLVGLLCGRGRPAVGVVALVLLGAVWAVVFSAYPLNS